MRHTLLAVALAALMVSAPAAMAENEDAPTAQEIQRHERLLELKAHEAELAHQQEMRKLELQQRRIELERLQRRPERHAKEGGGVFLLLILITHILLTVWVCKDMREQKIGRALWVPIVLLAGVFGAILYAIVRNADTRPKPPEAG